MKTIIVFLTVDWEIFSRRPMIEALARDAIRRGINVIAVNRPLCPFSTVFRKPRRTGDLLRQPAIVSLTENLLLYSPKYFLHDQIANMFPRCVKLNVGALRRSFCWLVRQMRDQIEIDIDSPVVWYYHPQQAYVTKIFPQSFNVFELYDSLADIKGNLDRRVVQQEIRWRDHVDLLLTTSEVLRREYATRYRHSAVSGNALTRDAFERLSRRDVEPSAKLLRIPSPRVGYAGVVSDRIDFELVERVARRLTDVNFIFVGRQDPPGLDKEYREIENLHFYPEVPQEEVPAVVSAFDIGWMPYRNTSFFEALNPLKFYELMAAGKAVVASNIPELHQFRSELVRTCSANLDEWVDSIQEQLAIDSSEVTQAGPAIASKFIWEDKSVEILKLLARLYDESQPLEGGT